VSTGNFYKKQSTGSDGNHISMPQQRHHHHHSTASSDHNEKQNGLKNNQLAIELQQQSQLHGPTVQ